METFACIKCAKSFKTVFYDYKCKVNFCIQCLKNVLKEQKNQTMVKLQCQLNCEQPFQYINNFVQQKCPGCSMKKRCNYELIDKCKLCSECQDSIFFFKNKSMIQNHITSKKIYIQEEQENLQVSAQNQNDVQNQYFKQQKQEQPWMKVFDRRGFKKKIYTFFKNDQYEVYQQENSQFLSKNVQQNERINNEKKQYFIPHNQKTQSQMNQQVNLNEERDNKVVSEIKKQKNKNKNNNERDQILTGTAQFQDKKQNDKQPDFILEQKNKQYNFKKKVSKNNEVKQKEQYNQSSAKNNVKSYVKNKSQQVQNQQKEKQSNLQISCTSKQQDSNQFLLKCIDLDLQMNFNVLEQLVYCNECNFLMKEEDICKYQNYRFCFKCFRDQYLQSIKYLKKNGHKKKKKQNILNLVNLAQII